MSQRSRTIVRITSGNYVRDNTGAFPCRASIAKGVRVPKVAGIERGGRPRLKGRQLGWRDAETGRLDEGVGVGAG